MIEVAVDVEEEGEEWIGCGVLGPCGGMKRRREKRRRRRRRRRMRRMRRKNAEEGGGNLDSLLKAARIRMSLGHLFCCLPLGKLASKHQVQSLIFNDFHSNFMPIVPLRATSRFLEGELTVSFTTGLRFITAQLFRQTSCLLVTLLRLENHYKSLKITQNHSKSL